MFATLTFALQIFALQKTAPYGKKQPSMAESATIGGVAIPISEQFFV